MSDPLAPRAAETPQPLPTPAEIALLEAHGFARCTARGCEWPDKYCTENAAFENALELLRAVRAAASAPHPQPAEIVQQPWTAVSRTVMTAPNTYTTNGSSIGAATAPHQHLGGVCPVCGLFNLDAGFTADYGNICAACGTEIGVSNRVLSYAELRQQWILDGCPWFDVEDSRPVGWDEYCATLRAAASAPHPQPAESPETMHPVSQVYFRAGLLACREYMARFVEAESPSIAMSIRANWWPALGPDFGPPRKLRFDEVTIGEFDTPAFRVRTADEVSPTQEALPIAAAFLALPSEGLAASAPHPQPARLCPECVEPVSAVTTAMGTMYRCDRCQTDWFKAASAPHPQPAQSQCRECGLLNRCSQHPQWKCRCKNWWPEDKMVCDLCGATKFWAVSAPSPHPPESQALARQIVQRLAAAGLFRGARLPMRVEYPTPDQVPAAHADEVRQYAEQLVRDELAEVRADRDRLQQERDEREAYWSAKVVRAASAACDGEQALADLRAACTALPRKFGEEVMQEPLTLVWVAAADLDRELQRTDR